MKKKIATKVNNKHQNVSNPEDENGKTDYFFSFAGTKIKKIFIARTTDFEHNRDRVFFF